MQSCSDSLRSKVLIIDDEEAICFTLSGILEDEGYRVTTAKTVKEGLDALERVSPDVLLLDIWLPDGDGVQVLKNLLSTQKHLSVIMMSGHATLDTAVECTKLGAVNFIEKPLSLDKVVVSVQNAFKLKQLKVENQQLRERVEHRYHLIGKSSAMQKVFATVESVSRSSSTVLITGENGTGKENVARQIHALSKRRQKPFVALNCAAIPDELIESELFGHEKGAFTGAVSSKKGRFEYAEGGTLFLDEIGDMSLRTQAKVLRVLQEQTFERIGGTDTYSTDVRILAATNKNLKQAIVNSTFREDLYYRLNVIPIEIPALRDREEDIFLIADHYLRYYAEEHGVAKKGIAKKAKNAFETYAWPGNVRELKNLIERLTILVEGTEIELWHLPDNMRMGQDKEQTFVSAGVKGLLRLNNLREARSAFEREFLSHKLKQCAWNVSKTAETIGMERSHLHRKIRQFGIEIRQDTAHKEMKQEALSDPKNE